MHRHILSSSDMTGVICHVLLMELRVNFDPGFLREVHFCLFCTIFLTMKLSNERLIEVDRRSSQH